MWNNLVYPSATRNVVFMIPPKVAGSSIKRTLAASLGRSTEPNLLHSQWEDLSPTAVLEAKRRGALCIGIVRNPFDRLVSCWYQKLYQKNPGKSQLTSLGFSLGCTFREFLQRAAEIEDANADHHFRSMHFQMWPDHCPLFHVCLRYEDLPFCWRQVQQLVPELQHHDLYWLNPSDHAHYSFYYTEYLTDLVKDRWGKDLEKFGYEYK